MMPFVVDEYRWKLRHTLYMLSSLVYEYRWNFLRTLYSVSFVVRDRNVTQSFSPYKRYIVFVVYFYTLQSRIPPLTDYIHCIVAYITGCTKPIPFQFFLKRSNIAYA